MRTSHYVGGPEDGGELVVHVEDLQDIIEVEMPGFYALDEEEITSVYCLVGCCDYMFIGYNIQPQVREVLNGD